MEDVLRAWLLSASHDPLSQAALIVLGTLILEDAATVLTAMSVQTGSVAPALAIGALYVGIVLGDLGLYGLGRAAAELRVARRWIPSVQVGRAWLRANLGKTVFVSRFLPGARLPTYTACGFLSAGFGRFAMVAVLATLIWTSLLFAVSLRVGQALIDHLGEWRWVGMAGFAVTLVLIGRVVSRLRTETS